MGFSIVQTTVRRTSGNVNDTQPVLTVDTSGMMSFNRKAADAIGIKYSDDKKAHPGTIVRGFYNEAVENPTEKDATHILVAYGKGGVGYPVTWVSPNSCRSTARQFGADAGLLGITRKIQGSAKKLDLGLGGEQTVLLFPMPPAAERDYDYVAPTKSKATNGATDETK